MHVSLIYFLLDFILRSLRTIRMLRLLRTVVLLSFLWVYAIMSGFSPAILRAAFMLSFVISGELVNRNSYVFNTLFASAFCLLLINPYFITDIGFQLSYLAVGGILVLQPMLYGLSEFRNIAADMIWKSATVSIAAQLLTFPLGLFYFGSFPNYFLIANLLAIPLSTAAIYSCLLLLCASFSIWLSTLLGKLCTVIISSLNTTIRFFESLPLSFIEGISIHVPETILIYAFIFLMIAAWVYRGANLAFAAALALITALGSYVVRDCYSIRQKEIIVYSVPGRTAIGLISGRSETLLSLNGNSNIDRYAANYRRYRNIRDSRTVLARDTIAAGDGFFCRNNFVAFYERRFLILDKTFRLPGKRVGKVRLDFILITESPSVRLSDLTGFFEFERVVISSACNSPVADKLKNECARIKKSLHSVTEKAFILRSG
jgi:competence protein ComEC